MREKEILERVDTSFERDEETGWPVYNNIFAARAYARKSAKGEGEAYLIVHSEGRIIVMPERGEPAWRNAGNRGRKYAGLRYRFDEDGIVSVYDRDDLFIKLKPDEVSITDVVPLAPLPPFRIKRWRDGGYLPTHKIGKIHYVRLREFFVQIEKLNTVFQARKRRMSVDGESELYSLPTAASMLNLKFYTLYNLNKEGRLRTQKAISGAVIGLAELEEDMRDLNNWIEREQLVTFNESFARIGVGRAAIKRLAEAGAVAIGRVAGQDMVALPRLIQALEAHGIKYKAENALHSTYTI